MQVPPAPTASSAAVRRTMQGNRKTGTRPEAEVRRHLWQRGLRYQKNRPVRTSQAVVRPDVVFVGRKLAVFIDGCYWHGCPQHFKTPRSNREYWAAKIARNRERDAATDAALSEEGWRVLRFWEHVPAGVAADAIAEALVDRESEPTGAHDRH